MKRTLRFIAIIGALFVTIVVFIVCFLIIKKVKNKDVATKEKNSIEISSDELNQNIIDDSYAPLVEETSIEYAEESKEEVFVVDPNSIPVYSGEPRVELNDNIPLFSEDEINTTVFEQYSELDSLGRCGAAFANLGQELMPIEQRGEIGDIRPSGWQTIKYNELIDGNYLYNRCHLIGYQLAGENSNINNLITGTRYLNIEGMLPVENMVANYIKETNNHVLYRVTPIFYGDNLVASGVTMEALSVEDKGKGVCLFVYVYNVQPGIIIDYASGDSEVEHDYENDERVTEDEGKYIVNTNTGRFHIPSCESVNEMKEKNKKISYESREELVEQGYSPCSVCNP